MHYKTALTLLLGFTLACQGNNLSELDGNTQIIEESLTVSKGNITTYTISSAIPTEGETTISDQAEHFELSEITTGTTGIIYQYKPKPGFTGNDNVEITQTFSNGGPSIIGKTIIRLSITVTSD